MDQHGFPVKMWFNFLPGGVNHLGRRIVALGVVTLVLAYAGLVPAKDFQRRHDFRRIFPLDGIAEYPPQDMVANCRGEFANAKAKLRISQRKGKTWLRIKVRDATPDTFFTVWLRLANANPLTGSTVWPLSNPSDALDLASKTPDSALTAQAKAPPLNLTGDDGSGSDALSNGFFTDESGHGKFVIHLDYPLVKGAFQFQEIDDTLKAIATSNSPSFRLRLASHCDDDDVGHGFVPGRHEMWFDWP